MEGLRKVMCGIKFEILAFTLELSLGELVFLTLAQTSGISVLEGYQGCDAFVLLDERYFGYDLNSRSTTCYELKRYNTTCYELDRVNTACYERIRINTTCYEASCQI